MVFGFENKIEKQTMADSISQLFEKVDKILSTNKKLNEISMVITQAMGYNGFKRWHRYRAKQFSCLCLCLSNEAYDKFRTVFKGKDYEVPYDPKTLEEHLKTWEKTVLDSIRELSSCQKEYFEITGVENRLGLKAMRLFCKDWEKLGCYIKRFTESDWLTIDMHIVDKELHEKYKRKEEYGYHN